MRFVVELRYTQDGRVEGAVTPDGYFPVRFSGWLELLRILEPPASEGQADNTPGGLYLTGAPDDLAPPP